MSFPSDLPSLNTFLEDKSYLENGPEATDADMKKVLELSAQAIDENKFPHVFRWFRHCSALKLKQPLKYNNNLLSQTGAAATKQSSNQAGQNQNQKAPQQQQNQQQNQKDAANIEQLLLNPVMGKVVTRFPPEPSGYMHVGHAKAAMLNFRCANTYNGKTILRFDDTNPAKEKQEYEDSIKEDAERLGVKFCKVTHTSDYFEELQAMMEMLILANKAFVDDTDGEQMKKERMNHVESKRRNNSLEENMSMWKEMLAGSPDGIKCCVRLKMDMKSKNGCLRDPAVYRCNIDTPHHKTGTRYKAYPMYDLACPLVDSWEGITHAMRTTEYKDRAPQYEFVQKLCKEVCDACNGKTPKITGDKDIDAKIVELSKKTKPVKEFSAMTEFGKTNFTHTVLSKRVLTRIVDQGIVDGWTDPRMPTVKGIMRRGMTVEALFEFMVTQGGSKRDVLMEWDKIWSFNARQHDAKATRFAAVFNEAKVELELTNFNDVTKSKTPYCSLTDKHPKTPELGQKSIWYAPSVFIDQSDGASVENGEQITLLRWGVVVCDKIVKCKDGKVEKIVGKLEPTGDPRKPKKKFHWVAKTNHETKIILREYDQLITKAKIEDDEDPLNFVNKDSRFDSLAFGESGLKSLSKGEVIQLERMGFYIVDRNNLWQSSGKEQDRLPILIKIPDGKAKAMTSTITGKVDAKSLQGANDRGNKTAPAASSEERPPGVPDPNADPKDLKALEDATEKVKTLKAGGQKPGDKEFDDTLNLMKSVKEKCGIREPTKAERKKMEKEAKAKGK